MKLARVTSIAAAATVLTWSALGSAEEGPVPVGTFAIGAERITGFFHVIMDPEEGDSQSTDEFALLAVGFTRSPHDIPRVAFDGFVTDGLSLGGSLAFIHLSDEDDDTSNMFLVAPRLGYAVFFSEQVGIWPRAGISYFSVSTKDDNSEAESSLTTLALQLDVPLLFSIGDAAWITVGPNLDLGLSGTQKTEFGDQSIESDLKYTNYGVSAGITVPL